jgi:hypothetical protein
MKALTICQPYAELIAIGQKRVENRTWPTKYRGLLYIHAGKSRQWLDIELDDSLHEYDVGTGLYLECMEFGAIVASATLVDCLHVDSILRGEHDKKYPWLRDHYHVNGPWCWVLDNVSRMPEPIKVNGAQGLWDYRTH